MQVCHGKAAPLRRLQPGDGIVYYSPTQIFCGKDKLQAFTAFGHVAEGSPYQADLGGGFCPFRRDVLWVQQAAETPIRPMLKSLEFTAGKSWGYQLRFGLFEIAAADMTTISAAMLSVRLAAA
jgi:EVE domain